MVCRRVVDGEIDGEDEDEGMEEIDDEDENKIDADDEEVDEDVVEEVEAVVSRDSHRSLGVTTKTLRIILSLKTNL